MFRKSARAQYRREINDQLDCEKGDSLRLLRFHMWTKYEAHTLRIIRILYIRALLPQINDQYRQIAVLNEYSKNGDVSL